jgi:hypothetical protein
VNWQSVASSLLILLGAAIMLVSILKSRGHFDAIPFVPAAARPVIRRHLTIHRYLMKFFLLGYLFVATSVLTQAGDIKSLAVGAVFFLGAVFVLIGVRLKARMLGEIQDTLQGLLPICSACKRIRSDEGDPGDQESWVQLETYLTNRTQAEFSHGMCPECMAEYYPDLRPLSRTV